ncbi:unnamed protein product, partial [Porites lobata]
NPFGAVNWPKAHPAARVGSCFACGSFGHFRNQNFVEVDFDFFEYEQGRSSTIVVAGRLKSHIQFWRSIGASQFILDVIEHGYRIPFHSTPPVSFCSNNKVKADLVRSGFVPNFEKSVWVPTSVLDWLRFTIDLFQGLLFVPGIKLKR